MREKHQIILLSVITAVMVIAATQLKLLPGIADDGAYVKNYSAEFYANGTLVERFTYTITKPDVKFLYRYWETELYTTMPRAPCIEFIDIKAPLGTYWYARNAFGSVKTDPNMPSNSLGLIRQKTYHNEVGAYNPVGYEPGDYTVVYSYRVMPPLEYDETYVHLNLKLASDHIRYENIRVEIENAGFIEKIYPHPPLLRRSSDKRMIVFTGSSKIDELLEFEFLMSHSAFDVFDAKLKDVDNISRLTADANLRYRIGYYLSLGLFFLCKTLAILTPIGLYIFWWKKGRDKEYNVPPTLSYLPNKTTKPWIVNLIYTGTVEDFDEDGLNATMLDLHMKNKIKIEALDENDIRIRILDDTGLDTYENQVMRFLRALAVDDLITT